MSGYEVAFYPDALKDIKRLDGSQRKIVLKAIEKIRTNPLPQNEGGFGKPLGNKAGTDLTGFMKIKLRGSGIRIVYRLIRIKKKDGHRSGGRSRRHGSLPNCSETRTRFREMGGREYLALTMNDE